MKKFKLAAGLLACCMTILPIMRYPACQASAVNLHDSALMTDEEIEIKKHIDAAVNLVNNERLSRGLSELATFPVLNELTCMRAEEISLKDMFQHYRPDGTVCFSILQNSELKLTSYKVAAENIAAGNADAASTIEQFMNSKGHRENILKEKVTHIGIGYFHDPNSDFEYYWGMFLLGYRTGQDPTVFEGQYIPERQKGDPDGSGVINSADATLILNYAANKAAGLNFPAPTGFEEAADINGDGAVNAIDASAILEYSAAKGAGKNTPLSEFIW